MAWTHLLTGLLLVVSAGRAGEPAIAGYWTFDPSLSDGAAGVHRPTGALAEALRVQEHLTIAPVDAESVLIVDGAGISRLYRTDGTAEQHEFEAGAATVRTVWAGAGLRQTFDLAPRTRVTRTLRRDLAKRRLVEELRVEDDSVPRTPAIIRNYASDQI
jgi:hypothetical protein